MEKKINRGVIRTGETDIKVHLIDSFPNHPYHVFDDEDMTELAASIEANGLLNPIIVRSKADGRYELISGHRRKRAYEILKINKIRAIIVEVSDDEAIIMMVDSNCQRSKILPSEKAFSYKMKLDAIKRQGKRNDLTSTQVVSKLRSTDATINLIANNITLGNEQNDVNLNVIDTVTGMDCSRIGILIPQTKTDVVITIDYKADGLMKSVTYTMPELKLESGKRTTLNLRVGDEVVAIENVTVSDWADGGNIVGGEAEECMHVTYENNTCTVCGKKKEDGQ